MDDIIKFTIIREYKKLEYLIQNNINIDENGYVKLLHVILFMHSKGYLDDEQTFCFFYLVGSKIKDITKIIYLNDLIPYFNKVKSPNIINYLKVKRDIIMTTEGLRDIINIFQNSNGTLKFESSNEEDFYSFVFGKLNNITSSFSDCRFIDLALSDKDNKNNLKVIHQNEIKDRLSQLIKLFGTKLMKFMGIPLILNYDFDNMSFEDKSEYYKMCIGKLINATQTLKKMISKLKTLEEKYSDFTINYKMIINPVPAIDGEDNGNIITGINNIDTILNDLVDKYFN